MKRLAAVTFAAFVVLALVIVRADDLRDAQVQANRAAAIEACRAQNQTRAAVADVFVFMQSLVERRDEPRTPAEERRAREFFDGVAFRLRPVTCNQGDKP